MVFTKMKLRLLGFIFWGAELFLKPISISILWIRRGLIFAGAEKSFEKRQMKTNRSYFDMRGIRGQKSLKYRFFTLRLRRFLLLQIENYIKYKLKFGTFPGLQ